MGRHYSVCPRCSYCAVYEVSSLDFISLSLACKICKIQFFLGAGLNLREKLSADYIFQIFIFHREQD